MHISSCINKLNHKLDFIVLVDPLITSDLQRGGHRQHSGPQQQVGHGQVDDEVVGGDPQVSVADHGQDDQNVADDCEQNEESQHHTHWHRPAQVQRGGDVLGADAVVDGRVRAAVKIRRGAVAPRTHGEESPVTTGDGARSFRKFKRDFTPRPACRLKEKLPLATWRFKNQRTLRLE